nr:hypothetical protein [Tanacetum cinerariifolium]
MGVHVPHDIVSNHILPRLPAKSVCRFNCVSKEWHSFLTSHMFKNKHNRMHVNDHQNNIKLLVFLKTEPFEFTTIDCEAPSSDKVLTPTHRPLPPFEDTTPNNIHILTSFHGLVCLGIIKDKCDVRYSYIILWNPLTNEYKRLSKCIYPDEECNNIWDICSDFGLYYNCCEDDYKLLYVNLFGDNVCLYSLKSESWRKLDVFQHTSRLYVGRWSKGIYLNENLYFLQDHSNRNLNLIIRFDTKTKWFSKIQTPNVDDIPYSHCNYFATIVVKSDCIHVFVKYDSNKRCGCGFQRTTSIKLWKLDEYGNMEEVLTYQLRPFVYDNPIRSLIPLHLMKNGKWLMRNRFSYHQDKIYKVDLKNKQLIKDNGKEKGIIYDDFEYLEVRVDDVYISSVFSDKVLYSWGDNEDVARKLILISSCLLEDIDYVTKIALLDAAVECVLVDFGAVSFFFCLGIVPV